MNDFTIYPAIDLREGRVVRLAQGDPDRETAYDDQPLAVARRWQTAGATWLHVVNLDGAFGEGGRKNVTALARILTTGLKVQFGGGVRDLETVRRVLDMGVARVVLGTVAVENPAVVEQALADFGPERLAVGIDARDGYVRTRGWREAAPLTALELAQQWEAWGGRWVIFTDIARDGMSDGVNVEATAALAQATGLSVIASGGVTTLDDVQRVKEAGLRGVIIGRALYERQINLEVVLTI
ncbi:MAG TPA: 1-(5-phosphoribosyl)-5-[(5-phosphoribosylamino)methylideneamino]imidazole-4-carboxamide isomerase [Anaerolineae bacterium]|nr:1-(5-phosphoribosyl)-5-[(5-phosphoribosylamino)methylideneamino]imidazole-4-carboxamide isomerase [Anaerolineae bacterium]HQH39869.1 1-(5-phosphoribosyl)-5-[(5-phosphoribosylamino)methylideneamino]imidazole-4-carboxamide isomerase [Anaerolineae bacterium]